MNETKRLLHIIDELYKKLNGVDAPDLAKEAGISLEEAMDVIQKFGDDELIVVLEIDMCCGADYLIKGLTEKGEAVLQETE